MTYEAVLYSLTGCQGTQGKLDSQVSVLYTDEGLVSIESVIQYLHKVGVTVHEDCLLPQVVTRKANPRMCDDHFAETRRQTVAMNPLPSTAFNNINNDGDSAILLCLCDALQFMHTKWGGIIDKTASFVIIVLGGVRDKIRVSASLHFTHAISRQRMNPIFCLEEGNLFQVAEGQ